MKLVYPIFDAEEFISKNYLDIVKTEIIKFDDGSIIFRFLDMSGHSHQYHIGGTSADDPRFPRSYIHRAEDDDTSPYTPMARDALAVYRSSTKPLSRSSVGLIQAMQDNAHR